MTKQTKTSITTWSGQWFDIMRPEAYEFDIEEIAHALSNLCRYTGHTNGFYSVAEHSVHVARIVPSGLRLCGLLHDAGEAYIGDVASPLKALLPRYKEIEEGVERAIANYYNIPFPFPPEIKEADQRMYWQERQGVANNGVRDRLWHQGRRATRSTRATGLPPHRAKQMFLREYRKIMKEQEELDRYREQQNTTAYAN